MRTHTKAVNFPQVSAELNTISERRQPFSYTYIYFYQKHHEQFLLLQPRCLVILQNFQTVDKYEIAELKNAACISLHNFTFPATD